MSWRFVIVLALALLPLLTRGDQESAGNWSQPANGMRGRLIVLPNSGDPFLHVYLELQNVLNVMGYRMVQYAMAGFHPRVTDENGRDLPPPNGEVYDGLEVMPQMPQPLVMPFDSTLRFRINEQGLGIMPGTKQVLDFGAQDCWVIPQDGHTYALSATFTFSINIANHRPGEVMLNFLPVSLPKY